MTSWWATKLGPMPKTRHKYEMRNWINLLEEAFYHVTPAANVPAIMRDGLVPRIGDRSAALGEQEAAIYLFPSIEAAEDAIMNWLGDEFEEDEPMTLLRVNLPDHARTHEGADFEKVVLDAIAPENIEIEQSEF